MSILWIAAALLGAPEVTTSAQEPIIVEGDKPKPRKVCARVAVTGSRMPQRVCSTEGEMDVLAGVSHTVGPKSLKVSGNVKNLPVAPSSPK
jgi:hypothetical protein